MLIERAAPHAPAPRARLSRLPAVPAAEARARWNRYGAASDSTFAILGASEGVEQEQSGEAAEHEPHHAQVDEGFGRLLLALVVLGQAPLPIEPAKGALDNPAPGLDDEALVLVRAFHNLDGNAALPGRGPRSEPCECAASHRGDRPSRGQLVLSEGPEVARRVRPTSEEPES